MKSKLYLFFAFFWTIYFYGQEAPIISYPSQNVFALNQPIENLVPINSGGSVPNDPFVTTFAG